MTKTDFLNLLDEKLIGLPEEDRKKSIEYYSEIIDDRIEDGMCEAEAVFALGKIEDIVDNIISEIPLSRLIKAKVKIKRALQPWEIVLIVFGALIGIPIAISLFAAALSIFASIWAVAISFCAVPLALIVSGVAGVIAFFPTAFSGAAMSAFVILGAALVSIGLTMPFYYLAKLFIKLAILSTKGFILIIKKSFIKREAKK